MKTPFQTKIICSAVMAVFSIPAYAETDTAVAVKQLDTVNVTASKQPNRKNNEVTGLGRIVKTAETLDKEQVYNIRDLTRYDPSVSVVEQGRGASSGYSIRGVDKNRVSVTVDGIPQVQSYLIERSNAGSGAINEAEYQNISSIEITKGANSADLGSGALGGSVALHTKNVGDILTHHDNWGVQNKTAYTGKNRQWLNSTAVAGKFGNSEAMAIYTHKKGHEIQAHRNAGGIEQKIRRFGYFYEPFELRPVSRLKQEQDANDWFVIDGECGATDCEPRLFTHRTTPIRHDKATTPPYTAKEQDAYDAMLPVTETLSAENYTGRNRSLPNPMDYQTDSWLVKFGHHFSPKHYVGGVADYSKQRYQITDMTYAGYWDFDDAVVRKYNEDPSPRAPKQGLYYRNVNPVSGLTFHPTNLNSPYIHIGQNYTRSRYFDDEHKTGRYGVFYQYQNPDKNTWADESRLSYDRQNIDIHSKMSLKHCAEYPTLDKNCQVSTDKPWSYIGSEKNTYTEQHNLLKWDWLKTLEWGKTKHRLSAQTGFDAFRSTLKRHDISDTYADIEWEYKSGSGRLNDPYRYAAKNSQVTSEQHCTHTTVQGKYDCNPRKITGHNIFLSFKDHMRLGKYFDLGLGARYDRYTFKSDSPWTASGKFSHLSYNGGLVFKPTSNWALSYHAANGFRVPAFYELFGIRSDYSDSSTDRYKKPVFKSEKSLNQEWAVTFKGSLGFIEASHFRNRYRDLIVSAAPLDKDNIAENLNYHNVQNINLEGWDIQSRLDWHSAFDKLPEGLYTRLAYSKIKPTKVANKAGFTHVGTPLLDTLQPSRYIVGIGYDHPEGKWGIAHTFTYSEAKDPNELIGYRKTGYRTRGESSTSKASRKWYTHDLTGYVNLKKYLTFRAGVYNLFNRKYTTWEAVRQTAVDAANRHDNVGNYNRYAAPGRNIALSLEMKF